MVNDFVSTPDIPPHLSPKVKEAREMFKYAAIFFIIAAAINVLWGLWNIFNGLFWSTYSYYGYYYGGGYVFTGIIRIALGVIAFIIKGKFENDIIKPIDQGRYKESEDKMILYLILGLIFGLVLSGILILLGHMKLKEVDTSPKYCPTCNQQLSYIQQYQSWYCNNCQDYKTPVQPAQPQQPQYGGQQGYQQQPQEQGQPEGQQYGQEEQQPQTEQPPQQQTQQGYGQQPQQEQEPQQQQNACPTCGSQLRWINEYSRWYCDNCQEYK